MPTSAASQEGLLRRSLAGEYLALALLLHSGLGALVWGAAVAVAPTGLVVVAAGCWVCGRAAGAFSQRWFAPLVSGALLATLLVVRPSGIDSATPAMAVFSWPAFAAMLAVVFAIDLAEVVASPLGHALRVRMRGWNWPRIAKWGLASAVVVYLVVIPTVAMIVNLWTPPKSGEILEMSLAELVQLRTMEALTGLAFFALGAAVGSFLNVVAGRAPRGESVVLQRSHCPTCGTQIEGRHNVPIIGWLMLGGRCHACAMPISARYPVVEGVAGGLFLLFYFVELISGGDNVPVRRPNAFDGVVWIIFYTKWDLVGLYLFHCFALSTLLTWALIDRDCLRVPQWLVWLVGGSLAVPPLIEPDLLPVTWAESGGFLGFLPAWAPRLAIETLLVGGVVGALLGWVVAKAIHLGRQRPAADSDGSVAETGPPGGPATGAGLIVGLSLGWQAAIGVWLLTLLLRPIAVATARSLNLAPPSITLVLLIAYTIQLLAWRASTVRWWPSVETTATAWWVLGALLAALCVLNRFLPIAAPRRPKLPEPVVNPIVEL